MEKWKARFGSIATTGSAYQHLFGLTTDQSNGFELDSQHTGVCDQVHTLTFLSHSNPQPNHNHLNLFYIPTIRNEQQNSKFQGARCLCGDGQWPLG